MTRDEARWIAVNIAKLAGTPRPGVFRPTSTSVTLQGKGVIGLTRGAPIEGGGSPVTLVNVNNTIEGDGTIGGAGLKLNNKVGGLIEANGTGAVLVVDTAANTIINGGTMAATVSTLSSSAAKSATPELWWPMAV